MIVVRRTLVIGCTFVGLLGCRSAPVTRSVNAASSEFNANELAFIRTDSEVFEGVVRGQLAGTEKEHPYHLDSPIFDSRPFGLDSGYARYFATLTTEDSSFPNALSERVVHRAIENRMAILRALNVDEGKRTVQQCPGLLVPPPRPVPTDSASYASALAKLRANCPAKSYAHLEVSPPIHGVSSMIRRRLSLPGPHPTPALTGELWTAIVDGLYASKSGAMADEFAWIFQRDPTTGRLKLLATALIMIAE